ncbi:MAG TPA: thiamine pyrophosphate-dependent enzyme [Burkholderiales bacterium]|nr:thiamine pyrophosphate-dependent enzyme [Burkholderiales bacterium]
MTSSKQGETKLDRRAVVRALLAERGELLVVAGLGAPAWDVTEAGDHALNFPLWGGMGGAAAIGLGLAIAQPQRRVLVLTGDGEMLMGLGMLATIGARRPGNLAIVVLDNEHYGETGMQPSHTGFGVDLAAAALACGFAAARTITAMDEIAGLRKAIHGASCPLLAQVKIAPDKLPLALPPRDGTHLKNRFREALLGAKAHTQR